MNTLKNHKLSCLCCKQDQNLEIVKNVHKYKGNDRFNITCEHCKVSLVMYTSVNGFYSVNSLSKNRLYYLLKTENKIKTAKITSKGLIEMSYDLIQKRHQLKLTQKDVAVIIGVSAATYSYYECAKVTPKKDKLRLLINFINS